jgi:hypothetical protein
VVNWHLCFFLLSPTSPSSTAHPPKFFSPRFQWHSPSSQNPNSGQTQLCCLLHPSSYVPLEQVTQWYSVTVGRPSALCKGRPWFAGTWSSYGLGSSFKEKEYAIISTKFGSVWI